MAEIMKIRVTGIKDGRKAARCDIKLGSTAELANLTELEGYVLMDGSIAWDIENADLYGLKSGTWYKQTKD